MAKKRPKVDLEVVENQHFDGINFSISDKRINSCTFSNCNILYSGGTVDIDGNTTFDRSCHFAIQGPVGKAMSGHSAEAIRLELLRLAHQMREFAVRRTFAPRFYKIMQAERAQALIEKGELRIGTLYDFRKIEEHGKVVGDRLEGIKGYHRTINETITPETEWYDPLVNRMINISPDSKATVIIDNCKIVEKEIHSKDCYVFCMTAVPQFDALEGYGDTCVEILDIWSFLCAISQKLGDKAELDGYYYCVYGPRFTETGTENNVHPALIKYHSRKEEKEVRALWRTNEEAIEPEILQIDGIGQYCRIIEPDK